MCLFAPGLGSLLGIKGEIVERRALRKWPPIKKKSLVDQKYYRNLGLYFKDNLPFRKQLVQADSWVDYYIFSDSATPIILPGVDNWLFFKRTIEHCSNKNEILQKLNSVKLFADAVLESGREFRLIVAPNKTHLYYDRLSNNGKRLAKSAQEERNTVRSALDRNLIPGFVDLWTPFEKTATNTGKLLFPPLDRHWNSLASLVLSQELINSLQPGLWDVSAVKPPVAGKGIGELTALMNLQVEQPVEVWTVKRAGVKVEKKELLLGAHPENPSYKIVSSSDDGLFYPGKTVVLGDSFIGMSVDSFCSYMEEVHLIRWPVIKTAGDIIREANTIIIESVEDRFLEDKLLNRLSELQEILKQ